MKHRPFLTIVLIIGVLAPIIATASPPVPPIGAINPEAHRSPQQTLHWQIDTVDSGGATSSLALDVKDRPHVSHYHITSGTLRYAHFTDSGWLTETVPATGIGAFSSLALDSTGQPHISCVGVSSVEYAKKTGSGWQVEPVASSALFGYTSLALGTADDAHISWSRGSMAAAGARLEYTHRVTTTWPVETVDGEPVIGKPDPIVGYYDSLDLHPVTARPHIGYYDADNQDLRYARFDGSTWVTVTVDSAGAVGLHTSLALDADGHPHVSYYDQSHNSLKYAHFDGTGWYSETVDGLAEEVGEYTSLALDNVGLPHISYYDGQHGDLRYAYHDGAVWHIETVDSQDDVGQYTSLALDPAGRPYIGYYDATNSALKVAQLDRFAPNITTGPTVTPLSPTSVRVTWMTDELADSMVRYGTTAGVLDHQTNGVGLTQRHNLVLSPLMAGMVYRFVAESVDTAGNTAISAEGMFKTASVPDDDDPTVSSLALGAANLPGDMFQMTTVVSDTSGVARVEFYLDGELMGIHYGHPPPSAPPPSPPPPKTFGVILDPAGTGWTRDDVFREHNLRAEATDGTGRWALLESTELPPSEPINGELVIVTPEAGEMVWISGDTAPPGTTVPIVARALEYEWECSPVGFLLDPEIMEEPHLPPHGPLQRSPGAGNLNGGFETIGAQYRPPWCHDVATAVEAVEFFVDNTLVFTSTPSADDDLHHHYSWDISGLPAGAYHIEVKAYGREDSWLLRSRYLQIAQGTPGINVNRTVNRSGSSFRVSLQILNQGTATAWVDRLYDHIAGFQPVRGAGANYTVNTDCTYAAGQCFTDIDLFDGASPTVELGPGESITVEYMIVPIFFSDGAPFYAVGHNPVTVEYEDSSGPAVAQFDRPYVTPEGEALNPILQAQQAANYLIVTSPYYLHVYNGDPDVEALLSAIGELAILKSGVLGYVAQGSYGDIHGIRNWIKALGADMRGSDNIPGHYLDNGYLLIVGEAEVVPAWHIKHDNIWHKARHIDYTDQPYANTSGGWQSPELMVGRIVGNNAAELLVPVQTSVNVHNGEPGYSFDRSQALVVAGRGKGVTKFENNADDIAAKLAQEFSFVRLMKKRAVDDLGQDINALFHQYAPEKDVIFYRDHCNPWQWTDVIGTSDFDLILHPDPIDFGAANPFAFACCCQAGRYENDSDDSMVERFLRAGAGIYIGSTENSMRDQNNSSCKWFYDHWVNATHSVASVFRGLERDNSGFEGNYWDAEYNFYGDPKFDVLASLPLMASALLAAPDAPSTLDVVVPDYDVTTVEVEGQDYDYVRIPGGGVLAELGQPVIPAWRVEQVYPAGTVVQGVTLMDQADLLVESGLHLSPLMEEWDATSLEGAATAQAEEDGWWPDRTFDWALEENADGGTTLAINLYPFQYHTETALSRFYREFSFEVETITTTVKLDRVVTDKESYTPGEVVTVALWLENSGPVQDVVASAVVKDGAGRIVEGLPLYPLDGLVGPAYATLTWDSSAVTPDDHVVEVTLLGDTGVLGRGTKSFQIGYAAAKVASLSASKTLFKPGETITLTLAISSTGTLPITGTASIEVHIGESNPVTQFHQSFAGLPQQGISTLSAAWDTAGVQEGNYRVVGYALYDSAATEPRIVTVATGRKVYLPVILK